ncbi:glycosyltransferase family 1 protein [uncultured Parabacteroides sp.]|jgi:glycosyltransferase involved in cell wall biosynthesis|uniref:glycosyltransferase family 4 protein n=1 Tax=uncultured Parabacteroides sp. TaxID=512312 RepID=UPI0025D3CC25|nr:glycosyltransferase family 1 protein [uncultured Parabacteroides sp.]
MKVAFDAKRITHNSTGLGNYGRYVIDILSDYYPENAYDLYSPSKGKDHLRNKLREKKNITYHYPSPIDSLLKSVWRSYGIIKDLKKFSPDIFHGLSNELPIGLKKAGIQSVVTIHDLIFIRYPQFYKKIDRTIYNHKFRKACEQADRVIAISDMTRQDIIKTYHIPEEKIDVVYQGCAPLFLKQVSSEQKEKIRTKYNLPPCYILSVGSIEQRKNLLLIVRALRQLGKDIHLIAIGKRTPYTDIVETYIKENNMQQQVSILNNVPFEDLPGFYQMADLFIYPSFFEGFGIPIIEALHSNVPVIAATGSCLEEAGGPDSLYVEPNDVNDLSEKINWILSTPTQAELMKKAGKEYVKRFTDQQIANDLMNVYRNVLNK